MDSLKYFDYAYMVFTVVVFVLAFEYHTPHGDRHPIAHAAFSAVDKFGAFILTVIVFFALLGDPQMAYQKALKISKFDAGMFVSLPLCLVAIFLGRYRRWLIAFIPAYYFFLTFYRNSTW